MLAPDHRIPVTIVTGFLGSGKTTLLRRLLAARGVRNVAVIVNEVAEMGIDQKLLAPFIDDVQLLENGCICCAVREDLRKCLAGLLDRAAAGAISHLVIETTGLADPTPILDTFAADPMLRFHFRIGNVVAAVDCVNAPSQLRSFRESTNQIAAADLVVLTKTDLSSGEAVAATIAAVTRLNPAVPIVRGTIGDDALASELLRDPAAVLDDAARFLRLVAANLPATRLYAGDPGTLTGGRHEPSVTSFCIAVDGAFDWSAFAVWLTMLLHTHGDDVLRVKGILNVADSATPVLINGVRRLVHRPEHLARWPDDDRGSVLVFIVAGLDTDSIRRSFAAFVSSSR